MASIGNYRSCVCFNNTHHHHHIIHPQIWWGLTNNPIIISFIHNMVCAAAHSHHRIIRPQYSVLNNCPPSHHPSTIWCEITNNPTIISFIHDMVCANNTHHHIIHPLWCANNSHHHIIHPQYAFLFEDYASLICHTTNSNFCHCSNQQLVLSEA